MAAVLFDFFGTLVAYDPSRTAQAYPRTHALLRAAGVGARYDQWLADWAAACEEWENRAELTGVEYPLTEVFAAWAPRVGLPGEDVGLAERFVTTYVGEWSAGVTAIRGVPALLAGLRRAGHTLVVVSNTHHAALVHGHLARVGIADAFASVVTSIEVGWRKPRPEIFAAALRAAGVTAADAVFVGDSPTADYHGATAAGIEAWLVDPARAAPSEVPAERRLASVLDLPVPGRAGKADQAVRAPATSRASTPSGRAMRRLRP